MTKKHIGLIIGLAVLSFIFLTLILLGIYYSYLLKNSASLQNREEILHQIIPIQGDYQLVWEKTNLEIPKDREPFITSSNGKFIAIGKTSSQQQDALQIIDDAGITSINTICPSSISAYGDLIFVGNCTSDVTAFDFTGNQIWQTSIQNEGNITRLIVTDNALFVYTEIDNVYRLSLMGSVQSKLYFNCSNVLVTDQAIYSRCGDGLAKFDFPSDILDWQIYLDEPAHDLPIVQRDNLIITTERDFRNLQVFDAATGTLKWRTSNNDIVSNVIAQGNLLFYVSSSGEFVGKNIETGNIKVKLQLASNELEKSRFAENPHYLAVNNDLIFIYTGDTNQLFATKIME